MQVPMTRLPRVAATAAKIWGPFLGPGMLATEAPPAVTQVNFTAANNQEPRITRKIVVIMIK